MKKPIYILSLMLSFGLLSACATYYQRQAEFNRYFASADLKSAQTVLNNDKKGEKGKNRLLYMLNQGTVNSMLGNYMLSNEYFNKADLLNEDYQKNYGEQILSLFTNPNITAYHTEDHEPVMIHYYKAINYMQLGNYESALVECRRMDSETQRLSNRYKNKNRYTADAFAYYLAGIVQEAAGDANGAFVAYRNAYDTYEKVYEKQFGISAPLQLKKDLLRMAKYNGFQSDVDFYEKKFGLKTELKDRTKGELIFFWNNGLAPIKTQSEILFTIVRGQAGIVSFNNAQYGLSFNFPLPKDSATRAGFASLEFIRVAIPKYIERIPLYQNANIQANGSTIMVEQVENISKIAIKSLDDRMLKEIGNAVIRLATKKASEYALRNQNQGLGSALSIINAISEAADTRSWQTLPYDIGMCRVALPAGSQSLTLNTKSANGKSNQAFPFTYTIKAGSTIFQNFSTLESLTPIF